MTEITVIMGCVEEIKQCVCVIGPCTSCSLQFL